MSEIQDFFIGAPKNIDIPPGEYEGPLIIRHSCNVNAHGATLWAKAGNYPLVIETGEVTIKNLRVEIVGKPQKFTAIKINGENVQLVNVEVYGHIAEPFCGDDIDGKWLTTSFDDDYFLPRTINLGTFAADKENEFLIKVDKVRENYRVISSVHGLKVEPQILTQEKNELKLTVAPMRDGNILYGNLMLEWERKLNLSKKPSKIFHRIYISGRAQAGAAIKTLPKSQTARQNSPPPKISPQSKPARQNLSPPKISPQSKPARQNPPPPKISPQSQTARQNLSPQQVQISAIPPSNKVKPGQRVSAPNSEDIRVAFSAANFPVDMKIDAYAFCLEKNNTVRRDSDAIFFNNPRHESLGVSLDSRKNAPGIILNLKNLPVEIQSVVICFSIYDESNRPENNFSNLPSPEVVVFAGENIVYEFPLNLGREKFFKALEIYRDKDDWKIHFIGQSSEKDFVEVCESYGLEII